MLWREADKRVFFFNAQINYASSDQQIRPPESSNSIRGAKRTKWTSVSDGIICFRLFCHTIYFGFLANVKSRPTPPFTAGASADPSTGGAGLPKHRQKRSKSNVFVFVFLPRPHHFGFLHNFLAMPPPTVSLWRAVVQERHASATEGLFGSLLS